MSRPASLPMYQAAPAALAEFWRGLAAHLRQAGLADVPEALEAPDDLEAHWTAPTLLLSQTCGYPLTHALKGRVRYVATPCYRAEGCDGAWYSSAVVVRDDESAADIAAMRGRLVAFNSRDSQSGYNCLRARVAPLASEGRFFSGAVETGAHRLSIAAIRTGRADLAAIDAVTLALLRRNHPEEVRGLRILTFTGRAPGLPMITALGGAAADVDGLRRGFAAACADPDLAEARAALLLDGVAVLPAEAYHVIPAMQQAAAAQGYPDLA